MSMQPDMVQFLTFAGGMLAGGIAALVVSLTRPPMGNPDLAAEPKPLQVTGAWARPIPRIYTEIHLTEHDIRALRGEFEMITPQQCRAGRALLDWPQKTLSAAACLSRSTIRDFENAGREILIRNNRALKEALEEHGVVFSTDGNHGVSLASKKEGSR